MHHIAQIVGRFGKRLTSSWRRLACLQKPLTNLYRCTIESILSGCISAWLLVTGYWFTRPTGGWWRQRRASSAAISPPCRASTAHDVLGKLGTSSRSPATQARDCSCCCRHFKLCTFITLIIFRWFIYSGYICFWFSIFCIFLLWHAICHISATYQLL